LERRAYAPGKRKFFDIDILIRPGDSMRATTALKRKGYNHADGFLGPDYQRRFRHHSVLSKRRMPSVKVELHTMLVDPFAPFRIDVDDLFRRSRFISINGLRTRILCDEHMLLHLCIHSLYSHPFEIIGRSCQDISCLINRNSLHWDEFVSICRSAKASAFAYSALVLACNGCNKRISAKTLVPKQVLRELKADSRRKDLMLLSAFPKAKGYGVLRGRFGKWTFRFLVTDGCHKKANMLADAYYSARALRAFKKSIKRKISE
jgi:hypothetical protein